MVFENLRRRLDVWTNVVIASAIYDKFSKVDKVIATRLARKFLSGDYSELSEMTGRPDPRVPPTDSLTYNASVTELKKKGYDIS